MRLFATSKPPTTFWETSYSPAPTLVPATNHALAKAVGAAEALKGEKYKPAIFNVKWG
jgi:hypothetical protein